MALGDAVQTFLEAAKRISILSAVLKEAGLEPVADPTSLRLLLHESGAWSGRGRLAVHWLFEMSDSHHLLEVLEKLGCETLESARGHAPIVRESENRLFLQVLPEDQLLAPELIQNVVAGLDIPAAEFSQAARRWKGRRH